MYWLFNGSLIAALLLLALLRGGSCLLLADAGRRLISRAAGIIAGFGLALYAPAIYVEGLIQNTALALFFHVTDTLAAREGAGESFA